MSRSVPESSPPVGGRLERPLPLGAALSVAFAAAAGAFLGTLVGSDDPDMFHHLALGREILRGSWPASEPFLYPLHGIVTGPPAYWLGSVVIYLCHLALGEPGLSILPAIVGALLALLLVLDARPRGARHTPLSLAASALPIALALEIYRYRAVARTEIFSLALLAWTMWAIRRFEDGRPRALLAFPLVALVWTNLHPGTAVALVPLAILVATRTAAALANRPREPGREGRAKQALVAGGVLVAGIAASAVNPTPANPVWIAVRFALGVVGLSSWAASGDPALSNVLSTVQELRGGGIALWTTPAGALIALAALSFLARGRAVRPRELLTVGIFAVLPFTAVRFAVFFGVVAAPIVARNLGAAVAALPLGWKGAPVRSLAAAGLAAMAIASVPLGAQAPHIRFGAGVARGLFPERGVDYLQQIGFSGRLFNTFHLGGYLEWRAVGPPFQDGRGGTLPEDAAAAMAGPMHRALFAKLDERYRFDALLVAYPSADPTSNPLAPFGIFDPDRGRWALVAFDDGGLLYLRRDGRYASLASRDQYQHVTPASPLLDVSAGLPAAAWAEYRRSVRESPSCVRCRFFLAEYELAYGSPAEAVNVVNPALEHAHRHERVLLESVVRRAGELLRSWPRAPPGG